MRGDESSMDIERRLDIAIEDHFNLIQQQNEVKRAKFMVFNYKKIVNLSEGFFRFTQNFNSKFNLVICVVLFFL